MHGQWREKTELLTLPPPIIDQGVNVDRLVIVDVDVNDEIGGFGYMVMVRQFDEDAVLEKVLEVFWAKGWQGASMADLAGAANVQRGSLYHAYGDKEQLFLLAFDRHVERVLAESRAALDAPSARKALQRFFDVSIASMTADDPPKGCFTTKTAIEAGLLGEEVREKLRSLLEQLQAAVAAALARPGIRESLTTHPDQAAQIVIAFTRGLAVMERVYHDPKQLRALSRSLVDIVVRQDRPS